MGKSLSLSGLKDCKEERGTQGVKATRQYVTYFPAEHDVKEQ